MTQTACLPYSSPVPVTNELCILGRSSHPLGIQFTRLNSQKLSHLSRVSSSRARGEKGHREWPELWVSISTFYTSQFSTLYLSSLCVAVLMLLVWQYGPGCLLSVVLDTSRNFGLLLASVMWQLLN